MASSELLKQIQAGKKLKKSETNDRSGPTLEGPKGGGATRAPSRVTSPSISLPSSGGPPQLGGLFAGGMPKLKPAAQNTLAKAPSLARPPPTPSARSPPATTATARPPPPRIRPTSPSSRPSPPVPPRTGSPVKLPARAVPAIPPRTGSPSRISPTKSALAKAPPPPPPRSSGLSPVSPARAAPPPPVRRPPATTPLPPPRPNITSNDPPLALPQRPPVRRDIPGPAINGRPPPPKRKIPSPPPQSGGHTFPINNFSTPRDFHEETKLYPSGSLQGSSFDLGTLE